MHEPQRHRDSSTITGGVSVSRNHDSSHKHVTGEAIYTDDIAEPPGMLQIYLAMSERAHAAITRLDVEKSAPPPASPSC